MDRRRQPINEPKQLVVLGAGGHGRVCADIALAMGRRLIGFCDNRHPIGCSINGIEVVASDLSMLEGRAPPGWVAVFIAVGDNRERGRLFDQAVDLGYELDTLIHPSAIVSPTASLGVGSVLMPGTIINANAEIGKNCIVNTAASLDHDARLGVGVQICPGVRVAGRVTIGGGVFIGTGAVVIPGVTIGAQAIIGAGSVVLHDVADDARIAGIPARPIKIRAKTASR